MTAGAGATDTTSAAATEQEAAITASATGTTSAAGSVETGTADAAVADQPGGPADKTIGTGGGTGCAGPAIAEQEPAIVEAAVEPELAEQRGVGTGGTVNAVADQIAPEQVEERRVDDSVHLLTGRADKPGLSGGVDRGVDIAKTAIHEVVQLHIPRSVGRGRTEPPTTKGRRGTGMQAFQGRIQSAGIKGGSTGVKAAGDAGQGSRMHTLESRRTRIETIRDTLKGTRCAGPRAHPHRNRSSPWCPRRQPCWRRP
ncbi:hypothetical protein MHEI_27680 [Mycobacterium heidelbergense]|nr:hypothetical protein MHEI_27680 [Mycobacterium heidelbergense]